MPTRRIVRPLLVAFPLAVLLPFLQSGCGDDSKTGGTQLTISPEAKTQINDMREMYKANKKKAGAKKQ
jgi:hypothetical protein